MYDDPNQQPIKCWTIVHNDDDRRDPAHRRVKIEIYRRPVGDYEIFADGEPLDGMICETKAEAEYTVTSLWGDSVWDLRR